MAKIKIRVKTGTLHKEPCEIGVLCLFEQSPLSPVAKVLDKALGRAISNLLKKGEFKPGLNKSYLLHTYGKVPAKRLLLLGLGKKKDLSFDKLRQATATAARETRDLGLKGLTLPLYPIVLNYVSKTSQSVAEGLLLGLYRFERFKHPEPEEKRELETVTLLVEGARQLGEAKRGVRRGETIAEAACFTRDLVNLPPNEATPDMLTRTARDAARRLGLRVKVWKGDALKKLGMGGIIAVGKGSSNPPQFVTLEYGTRGRGDTVALVGKGVTFDSGGISIKPSRDMDKMKGDMAGAATVLGAIRALARLKVPLHIIGLLPLAENMPSGTASRPGDIITCLGGKTVEIITTDAEGRLIVGDALAYARRYKPRAMIDLATLTGACVVALGNTATGMLGNNEELKKRIKEAGEASWERVWELPLWDDYDELIKSDIADMKNAGPGVAGAITGACFLKKFVEDSPWVHLDIAGTAWADKSGPYWKEGGTGAGVRLLVELLSRWSKFPARK
ncbi:MAG: leucyl aminopeptidase [Omnitrophica bacterium RIFCSPLOWO2_12_FULL_50_11]|nr:MAG: leucyl aminopeptidase [Omnitrophica bacterium RIFCSPLOWO2_12_FULL_50_11]HLA36909.1 leucyl aminopeptidase [Candidatus Brocadiales bacterium]